MVRNHNLQLKVNAVKYFPNCFINLLHLTSLFVTDKRSWLCCVGEVLPLQACDSLRSLSPPSEQIQTAMVSKGSHGAVGSGFPGGDFSPLHPLTLWSNYNSTRAGAWPHLINQSIQHSCFVPVSSFDRPVWDDGPFV